MARLIRPPDKADVTAFLRMLFLKTEQEIIHEITRKRNAGYVDYAEAAALERVQRILNRMVDESFSYVPVMIEKIFYRSGKDAAGYANARTLTSTQLSIMEQLGNNLLGELTQAAETAGENVRKVFTIGRLEGDPFRKEALAQVMRQQAAGGSWMKSSRQLAQEIQNKGIPAFTDKAGRTWSLQDYSNMAVRTTARQAEVAALLTADDYDLWQIVKIGSTCPVCAALEGRVYSKSGTNPEYPPLTLAFGKVDPSGPDTLNNTYLNIHPNCLHSFVKYTTIGKTDKQIQKDKDFSDPKKNPLDRDPRTKKQIEAYRKKERERQRLIRDKKRHQEYRAMLRNEVPKDFETFEKHRQLGDKQFQKWRELYRGREALRPKFMPNKMRIKLPDDVMGIKGMTEDSRIQIEKAITLIEKQYNLRIGEIFVESLGPHERNTYFIVGPYKTENGLKMGLVVNNDINYTHIKSRIKKHYDNGFFASKDLKDCIIHEMAHVLTFQGCSTYEEYKALNTELDKDFVPGISGYADRSEKGAEALAEAFVKYRNGEKIPFRMKQLIKKYIERWKK